MFANNNSNYNSKNKNKNKNGMLLACEETLER